VTKNEGNENTTSLQKKEFFDANNKLVPYMMKKHEAMKILYKLEKNANQ
jgi:hypothetical protein